MKISDSRGLRAACQFLAALLLVLGEPALAQSGSGIQVEEAWARRAAQMKGDAKAGSGNGAVYATLRNRGAETDMLVGVECDAAKTVEIHETYPHMGMMMMRQVTGVEVPAAGSAQLKPGGYHVMLIDLKRDLKAGDKLPLTLQFRKAGNVPVTATVR